jgi:hypothetical protein
MKAVQINRFGGPEVLEVVEVPTPTPAPGQLLVRIDAIGVNFADTLMRADRYAITPPLPAILGFEAAGVVEALGSGVEGVKIGQRVAAPLFATDGMGAYAEFIAVDASLAVPLPDGIFRTGRRASEPGAHRALSHASGAAERQDRAGQRGCRRRRVHPAAARQTRWSAQGDRGRQHSGQA